MKIGLYFGSTLGSSKAIAELIAKEMEVDLFDVSNGIENITTYEKLIFGTNTWGYGELQDDWEGVVSQLNKIDFSGKKIAIYGTGDSEGYSDTFVDAIGILAKIVEKQGGKLIGLCEKETYNFENSLALRDGKFLGLPIDNDNQFSLTEERVKKWIIKIKGEF